jgi:hypothetical protein
VKYVICMSEKQVQVLRRYGYEQGIPVYEHYKTFEAMDKGRGAFERAADLVRKLEAA